MIKYDPDFSLSDYERALDEFQQELSQLKTRRILAFITNLFFFICSGAAFLILLSSIVDLRPRILFLPIVIAIIYFFSMYKFSAEIRQNSFAGFLNCGYKKQIKYLAYDIDDIEYYIRCLRSGEEIDTTRCYVRAR